MVVRKGEVMGILAFIIVIMLVVYVAAGFLLIFGLNSSGNGKAETSTWEIIKFVLTWPKMFL
jgi:hypothetical protein